MLCIYIKKKKKQWHTKDMCQKFHVKPSKSNNNNMSWKPNNKQEEKGQEHAYLTSSNQPNNENKIQKHGKFKK